MQLQTDLDRLQTLHPNEDHEAVSFLNHPLYLILLALFIGGES